MNGRVLIAAGSDSGGGAGIQADIKTVTAFGGYAATAVTALTAQNTLGVHGIYEVSPDFVTAQMEAVLSDIGADAVKTGMLHTAPVIEAVTSAYERYAGDTPLVVDPVMVAKGGERLLEPEASQALRARLILRATVLTPNIPEAEALTGMVVASADDMPAVAEMLLTLGPTAVLLKGGHLEREVVTDILYTAGDHEIFESPRIDTPHTHGTGCTLASAIAAGLAQGMSIRDSIVRARAYVHKAIACAPGFGGGHGPLDHTHTVGLADPATPEGYVRAVCSA